VTSHTTSDPPPDLAASPLYLLAVLVSARRSKDRALERVTRRRLDRLGIRIAFADELTAGTPERAKGAGHE
jgi:hypothetical protein